MIGATDGTGHHAEDSFGIAGEDIVVGKEGGGKHCRHTGVLHSHLYRYRALLGK